MIFTYDKRNGEVKTRSEAKNTYSNPNFADFDYIPTSPELDKINQNYRIFVKNGALVFLENDFSKAEKKKVNVADLKEQIKNATTQAQIKTVLASLLDNL